MRNKGNDGVLHLHRPAMALAIGLVFGALFAAGANAAVSPTRLSAATPQSTPAIGEDPGFGADPSLPSPEGSGAESPTLVLPKIAMPTGPVTIHRDFSKLPAPVARLRNAILKAAATGDISKLGPIFAAQPHQPQLAADTVPDPVIYLRDNSNDGEGRETLAIMMDLLDAPYAVYNEGKPDAAYVWPAFVAEDLDSLSPAQLVDVYRIVSSQDLEDMRQYGAWFFYRLGISAKGDWLFFVAGQ